MRPRNLLPLCLIPALAAPLLAQETPPRPPLLPSILAAEASRNAVLRGINQVQLDVNLSEGARAEDAELRTELRDAVELELRRAGILLREGGPGEADRTPALRLDVKFDRAAGRFAARVNLAVRDQVTVTRNRETVVTEVWSLERTASSNVDSGFSREVRKVARDLTGDFLAALRKANAPR